MERYFIECLIQLKRMIIQYEDNAVQLNGLNPITTMYKELELTQRELKFNFNTIRRQVLSVLDESKRLEDELRKLAL
jgi:hypothetical protein